ncbi:MAG: hypothetical protein Q4P30_00405 [Eubacteriales bacterium]|nr:hypothetical protein [Eubacteriales bacterium]
MSPNDYDIRSVLRALSAENEVILNEQLRMRGACGPLFAVRVGFFATLVLLMMIILWTIADPSRSGTLAVEIMDALPAVRLFPSFRETVGYDIGSPFTAVSVHLINFLTILFFLLPPYLLLFFHVRRKCRRRIERQMEKIKTLFGRHHADGVSSTSFSGYGTVSSDSMISSSK